MVLIDAHDAADRSFAASLHGVNLASDNPSQGHKPGFASNSTRVGFNSFYHDWYEKSGVS